MEGQVMVKNEHTVDFRVPGAFSCFDLGAVYTIVFTL